MTTGELVRLVLLDFLAVVAFAILIGAAAPRWPDRWLDRDRCLLRVTFPRRESTYRALGVPWLARHLPELGATFGGQSKAALPGRDAASLQRYLIEVRRAEWVHVLSLFTFIPLAPFNPWWLTAAYAGLVIGANTPFLLILRHNRLRLTRVLARMNG